MKNVPIDIHHLAHLARLSLAEEELRCIGPQLADILQYMEKLKELDVTAVEPTAHAVPLTNVTRPDEAAACLAHEDALRNAPRREHGLFIVPRIIE